MPLGPYSTFAQCEAAQIKKGKSKESAARICGQIEKNTQESLKQASTSVKYEQNDHLYIKAFLLDASVNINQWGINPNSLVQKINSFIGKPLVLTDTFNHPLPPEMHRVGGGSAEPSYDNDDDPYNTVDVDDIVDHWLAFQEVYRIGSIIDITEKNGTYYAIMEVTDPSAKEAFRNNDIPLFVSPAIAQLDPYEDAANISNWTGIHLAIVSEPAYTIKKALITGQCHGDSNRCLLQLRQAAIERKEIPRIGCGFCRTKALARYAEVVKSWRTKHSVYITKDLDDFTNSSFGFSNGQIKTEELTDNNNNNNNTTNDTNKPQEFEKKQQQQGGDLGEQPQKGTAVKEKTTTTETEQETTNKEVTKTAAAAVEEVAIKVAGMAECVQIFQQNGVQDPAQAQQICKLAAQALMENQQQNQPNGGTQVQGQGAPKNTGQFGSVTEYEKELTKHELKIAELTEELKKYRKNDKTDAQRIAELEETVTTLNRNLKEKEIESYLVTKIADEDLRNKKIKRFADLNLTIDDVKDIFDNTTTTKTAPNNIKKVAEVIQQENPSPLSRVKLQVASTNNENSENDTQSTTNQIRERNNKIISSLLQKGGNIYS
jgi:hypothetical protein